MRPYVICHMMASVDGRTLTENWGPVKGRQAYEPTGNTFKADAWMSGRTTMERDFASKRPLKLKPVSKRLPKEDFVAGAKAKSFAIAVDRSGKLHWEKPLIDGDHLIVVLSEQVSQAYIADLRVKGISYIFGGKKELDLRLVLDKLGSLFGIKKLLLEGGGHLNGSFLRAGLIDELSILYVPVADVSAGAPSLFEAGDAEGKVPARKLSILKVKKMENDVIWVRYKVR